MTKHIVKTEAEWLELRKQYITASEVAVLVGADPYSSVAQLRKPSDFQGNAFTRVGQMLEPIVINVVNDILGTTFKQFETPEGHKEFYTCGPLGATPDAHMDRKVLLEAKTTRPQTYIKYGAVPPNKYVIQLLSQMMCVEDYENWGYLAIMSTNLTQRSAELIWPISIFKVWTDDRICSIIKEEAERFNKDEKFKVCPKVKQKIKLLLPTIYERTI